MVCPVCGTANEETERLCRHCQSELHPPAQNTADGIKSSWDLTVISSRNIFPENVINGRYKIIKVLNRGGMGEIFLAEDCLSRKKVAIKSISSDWLGDGYAQTRFRREAQAASLLDHPNICAIHEIAAENNREYIIMEYVDGVTLDRLKKMKPLALSQVIGIALQVAEGMIAAQAKHIVHLDIKPGNIMIDKSGTAKVLDFGLAEFRPRKTADRKTRRPEPGLSEPSVVMGSVSYMSPEQVEGQDLDGRSDIFSFGVVLFEMLAGKNPFFDPDPIVTMYNIIHKEVTLARDIPPALGEIVQKALQKDRCCRYQDFSEIKKDLRATQASCE